MAEEICWRRPELPLRPYWSCMLRLPSFLHTKKNRFPTSPPQGKVAAPAATPRGLAARLSEVFLSPRPAEAASAAGPPVPAVPAEEPEVLQAAIYFCGEKVPPPPPQLNPLASCFPRPGPPLNFSYAHRHRLCELIHRQEVFFLPGKHKDRTQ